MVPSLLHSLYSSVLMLYLRPTVGGQPFSFCSLPKNGRKVNARLSHMFRDAQLHDEDLVRPETEWTSIVRSEKRRDTNFEQAGPTRRVGIPSSSPSL